MPEGHRGSPILTPPLGATIVDAEGAQIGRVKESTLEYFKVDAPHHSDYWLSTSLVESISGESVRLNTSGHALEAQRVPRPPEVGGFADERHATGDKATAAEDMRADYGSGPRSQP
ncbi:MAG: hypothetical protein WEC33_08400 [Dehalococcoidia bacterium]